MHFIHLELYLMLWNIQETSKLGQVIAYFTPGLNSHFFHQPLFFTVLKLRQNKIQLVMLQQ